jgi:hypothetical protein
MTSNWIIYGVTNMKMVRNPLICLIRLICVACKENGCCGFRLIYPFRCIQIPLLQPEAIIVRVFHSSQLPVEVVLFGYRYIKVDSIFIFLNHFLGVMALISPTAGRIIRSFKRRHNLFSLKKKKAAHVFIWIVHAFTAGSISNSSFHLLSLDGVKVKSCKKRRTGR